MNCSFCGMTKEAADKYGVPMIAGAVEPVAVVCAICAAKLKEQLQKDDVKNATS